MNILVRADSSSHIGLGHIMRDLVLVQQYPNDLITFACQELPGNIMDQIPYGIHVLQSNDPKELITLIQMLKIDMIVFDHYGINADFEQQVKEQTGVSVFSLDDTYEHHHCDILLNHNICANSNRYRGLVPTSCELRCGSAYTLIRDEFKNEKTFSREKIYDIFIAMGGADTANLTMDILKTLDTSLRICVVTTTANAHLEDLKRYVKGQKNISLHVNSHEIAKLLHQSHFSIVTPSVIVHEVLFMETPFVAIQTASNQDDMVRYLKQHNYNVLKEWTNDSIAQFYHS
ncbi:MAG TPA: UDP-2,4-diacetamido-2,4,6-trideoxy-beta-L-altropyranose hydrolase [Sulfuricurvum sp.]|nr:MAG: UDP-2,4-diacetamido-2,4,6-trideoxy-beta-L-altropyranose hydrolase [Campylobacterales bacterium 16-40-21]OZA03470.1 MAG: UDP-2,4-diacetamido-2,4,6-trideoxy-beta-L-altropyranose hydrolase [Sulfuricurvum sp. 17-40-25]HQS66660.1 UDP-2,4-diacetamido-2,4,6-trideoxy-beta-L-altropyranose hydrolase [Sulfuricurvum sp.]HQT36516.1 UDP-2,4-diacetamido-2,4,6-trideoxy-beta-L-altropyranose hydrolase [Sulfuricurvum sp.]